MSYQFNPGAELSSLNFGNLIGGPLTAIVEAQSQAALSTVEFIDKVGFTEDREPIYVSFKYPKEVSPYTAGNEGKIVSVSVSTGGSGHTENDTLNVSSNTGSGFSGRVVVDNAGAITGVTILNAGSGYVSADSISVTVGTGGTAATLSLVVGEVPSSPAVYQEMKIEVPILSMLPIPYLRIDEAKINFNAKINSVENRTQDTDFGIKGSLSVQQRWPGGRAKLKVSASYRRKSHQGISIDKTYSMNIDIRAVQDEMPEGAERLLGILENAIVSTPVTQ